MHLSRWNINASHVVLVFVLLSVCVQLSDGIKLRKWRIRSKSSKSSKSSSSDSSSSDSSDSKSSGKCEVKICVRSSDCNRPLHSIQFTTLSGQRIKTKKVGPGTYTFRCCRRPKTIRLSRSGYNSHTHTVRNTRETVTIQCAGKACSTDTFVVDVSSPCMKLNDVTITSPTLRDVQPVGNGLYRLYVCGLPSYLVFNKNQCTARTARVDRNTKVIMQCTGSMSCDKCTVGVRYTGDEDFLSLFQDNSKRLKLDDDNDAFLIRLFDNKIITARAISFDSRGRRLVSVEQPVKVLENSGIYFCLEYLCSSRIITTILDAAKQLELDCESAPRQLTISTGKFRVPFGRRIGFYRNMLSSSQTGVEQCEARLKGGSGGEGVTTTCRRPPPVEGSG